MMGIAIIWIMLFHSDIEAPTNNILRALWYIFVSFGGGCGVDLFFFLSGLGLVYSASKITSTNQWWSWVVKRFIRILPSYFLVALVFYALKGDLTFYNLFQLNFLIDGIRDFWFIPAIIFCYLLFPLLFEISNKIGYRWLCVISIALVFAISLLIFSIVPDYFRRSEIFILRIPCFIIGLYLGFLSKNNLRLEYYGMLFTALILTAFCFWGNFPGASRWVFTFGTLLACPIIVIILSITKGGQMLAYCGTRSLQIYLVHVSFGGMYALPLTPFWLSMATYFIGSIIVAEFIYRITYPVVKLYKKENGQ